MPQQKQLYFRVVDRQPYIKQIEKQTKPGVHESKEHRRSKSKGSGDATRSSLPADEYVTPTAIRAVRWTSFLGEAVIRRYTR